MEMVANKDLDSRELLLIELSKVFLRRVLECSNSDRDPFQCPAPAHVCLAVLYYTTKEYQKATDHCTLVIKAQNHLQCTSDVVEGKLLPKIDDNIDSAWA